MGQESLQLVPDELEENFETSAWTVGDIESLDWALSRISELQEEADENERIARMAIQRIQLKTAALNKKVERGLAFFRDRVIAYAQQNRELLLKGGKKKSRELLHGTISWRKFGGSLEVQDPEKLLEWAKSQPYESGFLRVKEEPAVLVIRDHHRQTGEIPPGTDISPERDELQIKTIRGALTLKEG